MTSAGPPPATREKSGCLAKGCLFGCVGPFVLVVVLFALGSHLAGPLLQQLRGRSEWADRAARAVDVVGILSPKKDGADEGPAKEPADSTSGRRPSRRSGIADSTAVPQDLPRHPRAVETLYNVGPEHILIYQRVPGPRDAAMAAVREMMRKEGWKLARENPGEWSTLIGWTKGARSCMVEFAADSGATEIWIRSRQ